MTYIYIHAMRGGEALGTRRRRLGELQWQAVVRCMRGRGERKQEREREWRVRWRGPRAEGEVVASASAHASDAAPLS